MATKRAELAAEIARLTSLVKPGVLKQRPPVDTTPRFRDGTAKDPLIRLEEAVDMERAVVDRRYMADHLSEATEIIRLRQLRDESEQAAASEQTRRDRQAAWQVRVDAEAAAVDARKQETEAAAADQLDAMWNRPPGS